MACVIIYRVGVKYLERLASDHALREELRKRFTAGKMTLDRIETPK